MMEAKDLRAGDVVVYNDKCPFLCGEERTISARHSSGLGWEFTNGGWAEDFYFFFVRRPTDLYINPQIATEKAKAEPKADASYAAIEKAVEKESADNRMDVKLELLKAQGAGNTEALKYLARFDRQLAIKTIDEQIQTLLNLKHELMPRKSGWRPKVEGVEPVVGRFGV